MRTFVVITGFALMILGWLPLALGLGIGAFESLCFGILLLIGAAWNKTARENEQTAVFIAILGLIGSIGSLKSSPFQDTRVAIGSFVLIAVALFYLTVSRAGGGPRFQRTRRVLDWTRKYAKRITYSIFGVLVFLELMPGVLLLATWISYTYHMSIQQSHRLVSDVAWMGFSRRWRMVSSGSPPSFGSVWWSKILEEAFHCHR